MRRIERNYGEYEIFPIYALFWAVLAVAVHDLRSFSMSLPLCIFEVGNGFWLNLFLFERQHALEQETWSDVPSEPFRRNWTCSKMGKIS